MQSNVVHSLKDVMIFSVLSLEVAVFRLLQFALLYHHADQLEIMSILTRISPLTNPPQDIHAASRAYSLLGIGHDAYHGLHRMESSQLWYT